MSTHVRSSIFYKANILSPLCLSLLTNSVSFSLIGFWGNIVKRVGESYKDKLNGRNRKL